PHANADNDEIGRQHPPAVKLDISLVDCRRGLLKMEDHAVFLVDLLNKIAVFPPEYPLQGPAFWRHDVDLDFPRSQRSGNLETNEARAEHDGMLRLLCLSDNRSRITERAQQMDMGLVSAGNVEANWLGAGRQQ